MKRTILVTGSTDGVGKLAATKLAASGHEVILHGRNTSKLQGVIVEIKAQTNNESVTGFVADLSDFDSIKNMVSEINQSVSKIDVLVNNAGVFKSSDRTNKDGFDMRFMVNYFAPYLLTELLIPLLNNGGHPRVINLSSAAQSPVSIEALLGKSEISEQAAYAQSKLALTMWSFELAKQLKEVQVVALNPGSLLNTKMVQEAYGHHWSPVDKGADILCDLAVSDKFDGTTGKYFDNDQGGFNEAHADAYDSEKIDELINETKKVVSEL